MTYILKKEDLINHLKPFGQEHLLNFWDRLTESDRNNLANDIYSTNFGELNECFKKVNHETSARKIDSLMQPIPDELKGSFKNTSKEQLRAYEKEGLKVISSDQVAVLLLAGGQGTRLGVDYPKGMYSVNLPSGKTLYQLQAERLARVQQLAARENSKKSATIPWYIMVSEQTLNSTKEFFSKNSYFGLDKDNIVFFKQGTLPCIDFNGKVILDRENKISRAPDGNGGLYRALLNEKIIDDMERRGIKYVHVYCVDNILVRMADPVFTGFCVSKNANCGSKVVEKINFDEQVGVICKVGNRFQVVEYSEISDETRKLRNAKGGLLYNAGNICNHFFSIEFLSEICR